MVSGSWLLFPEPLPYYFGSVRDDGSFFEILGMMGSILWDDDVQRRRGFISFLGLWVWGWSYTCKGCGAPSCLIGGGTLACSFKLPTWAWPPLGISFWFLTGCSLCPHSKLWFEERHVVGVVVGGGGFDHQSSPSFELQDDKVVLSWLSRLEMKSETCWWWSWPCDMQKCLDGVLIIGMVPIDGTWCFGLLQVRFREPDGISKPWVTSHLHVGEVEFEGFNFSSSVKKGIKNSSLIHSCGGLVRTWGCSQVWPQLFCKCLNESWRMRELEDFRQGRKGFSVDPKDFSEL